jgi:radical SAM protein
MTTTTPRPPVRSLHLDVHDRPFIVIWELTRACELVCRHCRADAVHHRDPLELTTDDGKRLIDDLIAYGAPRPILVFTGGDPFERSDLTELVRHAAGGGLSVALSPSVTPLLTSDAMAELRAAGASAVSLSLDGATALTHDAFRGVDGVWAQTLHAAAVVRANGLRLQINSTVTQANVGELPGILRWVLDLEVGLWSVFFLVPTGRGSMLAPLDATQVEQVLHWLDDVSDLVAIKTTEAPHFRRVITQRATGDGATVGPLHAALRSATAAALTGWERPGGPAPPRRRPPLDVNAGRGFVFVDHIGSVYPSGFLPVSVGSVRSTPLSEIYRSAPLLRALRDPASFGGRCGHCEYRDVCGGSRSHAFAVTGDPLAEDPTCAYQPSA